MANAPIDSAWVEVVPDLSDFRKQSRSIMGDALGTAGDVGATRFSGSFLGGIGKIAVPLAGVIAALGIGRAIASAVTSGIDLGLDSINLASAQQQSAGAVEAIFGKTSDAIKKNADQAATSLGLTKNAYQELASVLGAQLKNGGTSIDEVATKTSKLITLGSDLSAQFGGTTKDAVDALSSALKGERDPIERYGVSLNQTKIDAEAAALGFKKVGASFDTNAQQAATLSLIYKQTESAQGQFAAQTGTLAEQQQIFAAQLENVKTKLGEALLPAASAFASFASTTLIPILNNLVDKIGPVLTQAIADNGPAIKQMVDELVPLIPQLIDLGVQALPLVITGLQLIIPVLSFLTTLFTDGAARISALTAFLTGAKDGTDRLTASFTQASNPLVQFNNYLLQLNATGIRLASDLFTTGQKIVGNLIDGIRSQIDNAGKAIKAVMDRIAGFFPHSPAKYGPFSGSGWTGLATSGAAMYDQFTGGFNGQSLLMPMPRVAGVQVGGAAGSGASSSPGSTFQVYEATSAYATAMEIDRIQRLRVA